MKTRYLAIKLMIVLLLGLVVPAFSQAPDTVWTKTYGGSQFERGYSVLETSDNGYIIAGETSSFGAGLLDVWVIRTDSDGDTLWTKSYGTAGGYESARSIRQTSDGGFIIAGSVYTSFTNVLMIRINADGDTLWTKSFGGFDTDFANDVLQTPDGGFLICGETRSYHQSGFGSSIWLIRTNDAGDTLWTKIYGGGSYQGGNSINPTSDGGFIITGSYNNGGSTSTEVWILRTDASGDTLWTKTFGGDGSQEGSVVFQTPDGGYIVYGSTDFGNIWMIRTDQSGDSLWSKTIPYYVAEKTNSLDLTSDGGFIITGSDMGDALIIRLDESGNILWTKTIGGTGSDNGNAVRQVSDEGYIVCGSTDSYGAGGEDVWVIRLNSEGGTGIEDNNLISPANFELLQNYPNPFNPDTKILYRIPNAGYVSLKIYDVLGNEVAVLVSEHKSPGTYEVTFNAAGMSEGISSLTSGVYFYKLETENFSETKKLMLLK